eukprot:c18344_g2_i1 orf=690-1712(+)
MSHRVPNLDVGSSELDHSHPFFSPPRKGAADLAPSLFFCDQGVGDYSIDRTRAGACVPNNAASHIPWMETDSEEKRAHAFAMGRESALAIDVPLGHLPFQDDEMLSWLQYPLDDTFNKSYCSEQLCEQTFTSQGSFPGSISVESEKLSLTSFSSQLMEPSDSNIGAETLTTDAAMAMGAHQAARFPPHAGAEAVNKVHTPSQCSHNVSPSKATDAIRAPYNAVDKHSGSDWPQNSGKQNALNFSFFSQRLAAAKTSLQVLGTSSGPSNKERKRQPCITHTNKGLSSVEQSASVTTALTSFSPLGASDLSSEQGKEMNRGTDTNAQQKLLDPMNGDDNVGK